MSCWGNCHPARPKISWIGSAVCIGKAIIGLPKWALLTLENWWTDEETNAVITEEDGDPIELA